VGSKVQAAERDGRERFWLCAVTCALARCRPGVPVPGRRTRESPAVTGVEKSSPGRRPEHQRALPGQLWLSLGRNEGCLQCPASLPSLPGYFLLQVRS